MPKTRSTAASTNHEPHEASKRPTPPPLLAEVIGAPGSRQRWYPRLAGDELVTYRDACQQYQRALMEAGETTLAQRFTPTIQALTFCSARPHPLPPDVLRSVAVALDNLNGIATYEGFLRGQAPVGAAMPIAQALACLNPPLRFLARGDLYARIQEEGGRWRRVNSERAFAILLDWIAAGGLAELPKQPLLHLTGGGGVLDYEDGLDTLKLAYYTGLYPLALTRFDSGPVIITWATMLATRRDMRLLNQLRAQEPLRIVTTSAGDALLADPVGVLSTPAGIYDLRTGQRSDTSDTQAMVVRTTGVIPADAATDDTCPRFLTTLKRALPDRATRDWLQVALGYILTGAASADIALMFLGQPATGKTTVIEAIAAALGEYVERIESSAMLLAKPNFPKLTRLRGKRLAILSEMHRRYAFDAGRFKQMTGGGKLPGAHGDEFHPEDAWQPQFTMLIETNEPPSFGSIVGIERRLRVIPFTQPVTDEQIGLRRVIAHEEAPGILRWLMDGARLFYDAPERLQRQQTPAAIRDATRTVLSAEDPVGAFYASLAPSPQPMPFSDLYARLEALCAMAGKPAPSKKAVSATLHAHGFSMRAGHARQRVVFVRLLDDLGAGEDEAHEAVAADDHRTDLG